MTIDTTELRRLAQKAYQGEWEVDTRSGDNIWAPDCNIMVQCLGDKSNVSAMTSFLGAATPSTVLALLDERDELERMFHDACHDLAAINFLLMTRPENTIEEISRLKNVESAARNYVQRNGRNNIDPDYQKLVEVLG